jgi:hypothetical protein
MHGAHLHQDTQPPGETLFMEASEIRRKATVEYVHADHEQTPVGETSQPRGDVRNGKVTRDCPLQGRGEIMSQMK